MALDAADLVEHLIQHPGHPLMHGLGFVAFDQERSIAITDEQAVQLLATDTRQHCRIGRLCRHGIVDPHR